MGAETNGPSDFLFETNEQNQRNFWDGLDLYKLPRSGPEARNLGLRFFFTGEECAHGHLAPKYAKGNRCCACAILSSASRSGREYGGSRGAARANLTRAIASMGMARTYTPSKPCKHGHKERFVSTNNCVECDRLAQIKHKERRKELRLIKEYGLTFEGRDNIVKSQGNSCAICGNEFEDERYMHVDHCHSTGKVRGVLCSRCNQAIGLLQDDPVIIRAAKDYVVRHAKEQQCHA